MTAEAEQTDALTDGFHLVISALKINGIETIYNVSGIPITDLGRLSRVQGCAFCRFVMNRMRVTLRPLPAI